VHHRVVLLIHGVPELIAKYLGDFYVYFRREAAIGSHNEFAIPCKYLTMQDFAPYVPASVVDIVRVAYRSDWAGWEPLQEMSEGVDFSFGWGTPNHYGGVLHRRDGPADDALGIVVNLRRFDGCQAITASETKKMCHSA